MFNSLMYKQLFYSFNDISFLSDRLPLCRHYSSSEVRRGFARYVASKLQWANTKYEDFLKKRFPRFFLLYHTFVEGKLTVYSLLRSPKNCRRALWVLLAQQWGWETWLGTRKQAAVVHRHLIYEGFWRWKLLRERIQDPTHDQNLELK